MLAVEKLKPPANGARLSAARSDECLQLYQRELDYLLATLRRLGVPSHDVEDVVHDVFLVMYRRWEDYDRNRPLRPWLFSIAYRVWLTHRRKSRREIPTEPAETHDHGPAPDEVVAVGQTRQLLLRGLTEVPLERRAVLILHEVDEVPMREVAAQLGIPLFTAYSRLRKARLELEAALARLQKGPLE
jgi:RNA polymerase sigma-70 factor (ECF subfamily)